MPLLFQVTYLAIVHPLAHLVHVLYLVCLDPLAPVKKQICVNIPKMSVKVRSVRIIKVYKMEVSLYSLSNHFFCR